MSLDTGDVFQILSRPTDPASGEAGEMYFNSTSKKVRYHDGTAWGDVGGADSSRLAIWELAHRRAGVRTINGVLTLILFGSEAGGQSGTAGSETNMATDAPDWFYLKPSIAAIAGKTLKYRLVALCGTNGTAPACNFTYSLRTVTFSGATAGNGKMTVGATVGNTVAINTPAANAALPVEGTEFTAPADGVYTLAVQPSANPAANSWQGHSIALERRWV